MHRPLRSSAAHLAAVLSVSLAACSGGSRSGPPAPPADPSDSPPRPTIVECGALPAASQACAVTIGGAPLVVSGDILVPGTIYRGGSVAVGADGNIACVGCDCAASVPSPTRVACPRAVISAGLVDASNHLTYGASPPDAPVGERYEHRHDWRLGMRGHTRLAPAGNATAAQVAAAELRGILAGTTSVVGDAGSAPGLQRNLGSASRMEGLSHAPAYVDAFPLRDSTPPASTACADYTIVDASAFAGASAAMLRVGEGIDDRARAEARCVSSSAGGGHDLLGAETTLVNAIGLTSAEWAVVGARGSKLVWSPRSSVRLYGDTSRVTVADRLGVRIALGTDWLPTGSMNLLRELRCADAWNRERLGGHFGDEALWLMATRNAAEAAGFGDVLGTLAIGKAGDLAVFDARTRADHRAVIAADPQDVLLVVRGGKALYGDADTVNLVRGVGSDCESIDVCGAAKAVCILGEAGAPFASLAGGAAYPTFLCDTPPNEPTCVPARPASVSASTIYTGARTADDADGDGIPTASDRCPGAFDPIWPLDGGAQADLDGDGIGDVCDPCPLSSVASCSAADGRSERLADADGDGVPDASDNCPLVANADQADVDGDAKGDACDACPIRPNPRAAACPASVYEVKDGSFPPGNVVALPGALVTAVRSDGFFVQVHESDPGYAGRDLSGLWVATAVTGVAAGDRVRIDAGQIVSSQGAVGLVPATAPVVVATGQPLPAPTVVAPAEIATGGSRAAALEAVLVRVADVSVTDVDPPLGPGDTAPSHEFAVDGGLRVDDLFWLVSPFPSVGTGYASITGVLAYRSGSSKVEPRGSADVVAATP